MRIALSIALLASIAGCQETHHCGPGLYGSDCQFSLSGSDAGMDAGEIDAGMDAAESDAGMCNGACEALDQVCFEGVQGEDGGHASGCVQCVEHEDCPLPTGDAGPGVRLCVDFECTFGCRTSDDCDGNACRPNGMCSAYGTTQGLCAACDTDDNCTAGRRCASDTSLGPEPGYCLTIDTCDPRVYRTAVPMESIDGVGSTFCFPPTTCAAIADAASETCATDVDCGAPDLADGYCPPPGRPDPSVCSYRCSGNLDCVDGQVCELSGPRYCRSCIPSDGCP